MELSQQNVLPSGCCSRAEHYTWLISAPCESRVLETPAGTRHVFRLVTVHIENVRKDSSYHIRELHLYRPIHRSIKVDLASIAYWTFSRWLHWLLQRYWQNACCIETVEHCIQESARRKAAIGQALRVVLVCVCSACRSVVCRCTFPNQWRSG